VVKFTERCDYITYKGKIINDDSTEVYRFKWNDEFNYQRKLVGEDPKGYNGTSDEDSDEQEEEEPDEDRDPEWDINYDEMIWADEKNWPNNYDKRFMKWH
jgi:hypothetical protein